MHTAQDEKLNKEDTITKTVSVSFWAKQGGRVGARGASSQKVAGEGGTAEFL